MGGLGTWSSAAVALCGIFIVTTLHGCSREVPEDAPTTSTKTTTTTTTRTSTYTGPTPAPTPEGNPEANGTTDTRTDTTTTLTTTTTSSTMICSESYEDCRETLCCINKSQTCYKQTPQYYACKGSCNPSEPDENDPNFVEWEPYPWMCDKAEQMSDEWVNTTFVSSYWDCCRPSCSWTRNMGVVNHPVKTCQSVTNDLLVLPNDDQGNICAASGRASACTDYQPFASEEYSKLSFGFTSLRVGNLEKMEKYGLRGDENCGQCFLLEFTDEVHWGFELYGHTAHPDLVGSAMAVQVVDIFLDVKGDNIFNLLIPSAGQGSWPDGCHDQFPGDDTLDFDCDDPVVGCWSISDCDNLPVQLQPGCRWRFNWYMHQRGPNMTSYPWIRFKRVQCPTQLTDISLSTPYDNNLFDPVNFTHYM